MGIIAIKIPVTVFITSVCSCLGPNILLTVNVLYKKSRKVIYISFNMNAICKHKSHNEINLIYYPNIACI